MLSVFLSVLEKDRQVRVSPRWNSEVYSGWSGNERVLQTEAETTLSPWFSDR